MTIMVIFRRGTMKWVPILVPRSHFECFLNLLMYRLTLVYWISSLVKRVIFSRVLSKGVGQGVASYVQYGRTRLDKPITPVSIILISVCELVFISYAFNRYKHLR